MTRSEAAYGKYNTTHTAVVAVCTRYNNIIISINIPCVHTCSTYWYIFLLVTRCLRRNDKRKIAASPKRADIFFNFFFKSFTRLCLLPLPPGCCGVSTIRLPRHVYLMCGRTTTSAEYLRFVCTSYIIDTVSVSEQRFVQSETDTARCARRCAPRCAIHDRRPSRSRFARARARVTRRRSTPLPLVFSLGIVTTCRHYTRVFYAHAAQRKSCVPAVTRDAYCFISYCYYTGTLYSVVIVIRACRAHYV